MNDELVADIEERLQALAPASVVLVGAEGRVLLERYLSADRSRSLALVDWGALDDAATGLDRMTGDARYDLGLVCWTAEAAAPACASLVIARLRDLRARQLWVLTTLEGPPGETDGVWTADSLVALGLTRVQRYPRSSPILYLYAFDLASYKPTPEWLGPKHWAHPDRWEKDRW